MAVNKEHSEMAEHLGPHDMSMDEAINKATRVTARDFPSDEQPDLSKLRTVVLKHGQFVTKVAKYWSIRSGRSGKDKHNSLVLETLKRTKMRGWERETEHSITIEDRGDDDEILKLFNFLAALPQIDQDFRLIG